MIWSMYGYSEWVVHVDFVWADAMMHVLHVYVNIPGEGVYWILYFCIAHFIGLIPCSHYRRETCWHSSTRFHREVWTQPNCARTELNHARVVHLPLQGHFRHGFVSGMAWWCSVMRRMKWTSLYRNLACNTSRASPPLNNKDVLEWKLVGAPVREHWGWLAAMTTRSIKTVCGDHLPLI